MSKTTNTNEDYEFLYNELKAKVNSIVNDELKIIKVLSEKLYYEWEKLNVSDTTELITQHPEKTAGALDVLETAIIYNDIIDTYISRSIKELKGN